MLTNITYFFLKKAIFYKKNPLFKYKRIEDGNERTGT